MRYVNETALSAVSAAVNTNSNAIPADQLFYASAQIIATGSPTAIVKFQASNDPKTGAPGIPTNWTDIPSATVTLSASGTALIPKFEVCYSWLRISLVAGGTGTVTVNVNCKGA